MRILITNDDGINARGLEVLHAIATDVAGPGGEVWTVAPAFEQSGVGHCISYTHPTMIAQLGERRYAAEGSPSDCVLAGIHDVLKDTPPDLILSGVNRGNNSGENALYSGTLGACIEAAIQGYRSIALSQYYGPENATADDPFDASAVHGAQIVRDLLDHGFPEADPWVTYYNVNFPPVLSGSVNGVRVVAQGRRPDIQHRVEAQIAPSGRRFMWVKGGSQTVESGPGTDVTANLRGYISVTPMRADLTAHEQLDVLGAALQ